MIKLLLLIATQQYSVCDDIVFNPENYSSQDHRSCGFQVTNYSSKKCKFSGGIFVVRKTEKFCSILRYPQD